MSEFIKRLLVTGACLALILMAGVPVLMTSSTAPAEAAASGVSVLALAAIVRRWQAVRPTGAVTLPARLVSQPATRLK